jgi:hypothetical protein
MQATPAAAFYPAPEPNRILAKNLEFEAQFEEELATGFSKKIQEALFKMGVPPRIHKTTPGMVPKEIQALRVYQSFPNKGFGLVGPGGCGKSCALVDAIRRVMLKELTEAGPQRLEDVKSTKPHQPFEGPRMVNNEPKTQFKWVGWPAMATRMKGLAARREWTMPGATTDGLIQWLTLDPDHRKVLILDDIGMENVKADSYTNEQLELLIDEAYGWDARVFWTSNHTPEWMERPEAYGYRLVSRLTGLSNDAELSQTLPDLRVRKVD